MMGAFSIRDRGVGRAAWWMALAAALLGLVCLSWGLPGEALGVEEEEHVELPLGLGETPTGPLFYLEGGSGVQTSPKVYVIFWGTNFEKPEAGEKAEIGVKVRAMLLKLYEGMTSSAYEGILTQYFNSTGGPSGRVGSTVTSASWIDKSVSAPSNLTKARMKEEVEKAISTNKWTAELNAQFVVVTAPGSTYEAPFPGGCAEHGTTSSGANYAFVPYQGDKPFTEGVEPCVEIGNPGKDPIDKTSKSASHEFAETVTDPKGNEWGGDNHEIGDLCQAEADLELPDGAWAQKLWDDHLNGCSSEDLSPPHVYAISEPAATVTSTSATLEGVLNPEAAATHYEFELGASESYGTRSSEVNIGSGTANVAAKQSICGLAPSTSYHFRVAAANNTGTTYGKDKTFTTAASGGSGCPSAITEAASTVLRSEATLNGTVNPDGFETTYYFEYGTSGLYGKKTTEASAGSGTSGVKESQALAGLNGATQYHFRIVAANAKGTAYGADRTFTTPSASAPSAITGSATGVTPTEAIVHGVVNPNGVAATDQFEYGTTTAYGTTVPVPAESAGAGVAEVAKGYILTGLVPSTTYHFRLVATNGDGTTDGKDDTFTTAGLTPTFATTFGSSGTGNGQFNEPTGVAVDPINGNVVVSDEKNSRVQVFNEAGEFQRRFGVEGSGHGQFKEPRGVAVDGKGGVWVTDTGNDRVQRFTETGEYVSQFGTKGSGNGQLLEPKSLALDAKGDVWVADSGNNRVEEFNTRGEYQRQFTTGAHPAGVAVDAKGNVWSDDEAETGAIEEHAEKGELIQRFASRGAGNGQLSQPKRLAFDPTGRLWVADGGNDRVEVFDAQGQYITQLGSSGSGSGGMESPLGVAVDSRGDVWVADGENDRVDRWVR